MTQPTHPDYGLDAPIVVRNLFLGAAASAALAAVALLAHWPTVVLRLAPGFNFVFAPLPVGLSLAVSLGVTASAMVWSSRVGKLRRREQLLDLVAWRGDEQVLDIGCGRGLMLIAAARRLTTGKATGIDRWQASDLSANTSAGALQNAALEGVADRVAVVTGDMRELPFPDGSFDTVVSRYAIHNLSSSADRAQAIGEITRVLRPGGAVIIDDIRYQRAYATALKGCGCTEITTVGSGIASLLISLVTLGALCPGTLMAKKAAAVANRCAAV